MAPPLFNEAFIIFRLDEDGQPAGILPYKENAATYVATSIMICRRMLDTPKVKETLKEIVGDYDSELDKDSVVKIFIEKILEHFPLIFVDYSLSNPDLIAGHFRREWKDVGKGFETHKQAILINGPKVTNMCVAGMRAETSGDPRTYDSEQFRLFLFQFAKTILHELTHVFMTYLTHGKSITPPHIIANPVPGSTQGEAGRFLEDKIFGGTVVVVRDPEDNNERQAGLCYLSNEDGNKKIKQETIDKFVRHDFEFPIKETGEELLGSMVTLGHHLPKKHPSNNPLDAPEIREFLGIPKESRGKWEKAVEDLMAKNENPKTFDTEQESIMLQLPFKPRPLIV